MKFSLKILRIGHFENLSFFESAILNFFSKKKKKNAPFPWKSVQIYIVEWMGRNFAVFPGFFDEFFDESFWRNFCPSFWRILYLLTIASFRIGVPSILFYHKVVSTNARFLLENQLFVQYIRVENPLDKQSDKAYMCFKMRQASTLDYTVYIFFEKKKWKPYMQTLFVKSCFCFKSK